MLPYLVWRYAVHAAGQHQPLGPPVRLHRHFVHLHLRDKEAKPGQQAAAGPDQPPPNRDADPNIRRDIQALLHGDEFRSVSGWCVESGPYSGKTTVLCELEMRSSVQALRRQHLQPGDWGEVCLMLPVNRLAAGLNNGSGRFEDRLLAWMQALAPGLPSLRDLLQGRLRKLNLTLRPLFDALDELQAPTNVQRLQVERDLCNWLAAPGHHQWLAPVFTVREQEKASTLAVGHWRPRSVALLPWRPSDMRHYLLDRLGVPPSPLGKPRTPPPEGSSAARLLQALGLSATDEDAVLDAQPLTSFASFCATPGILSAQCTLIETWPQRQLPERRPDLLLALVWYSLHRAQNRPELDHDGLLPVDMRLLLANLATMDDWRLPPDAGGLVHLLAQAADAMQDAHGGRTTVLPLQQVFQRLAQALQALSLGPDGVGQRWWPAVVATGLAYREMDRASKQAMFRFVHPQFQELFAALGLRQDRLPDLEAPKLSPQPGQALLDSLKERGSQLALPQVTPHHERVRMAVVVALPNDRQAWLRRLLRSGNIGLAAQAAIDVKDDLEPDGPYPGDGRAGPHKVLQHLRRVLLLRSMDAGAAMHGQLRAGCVLGADANHAALAEHMTGVDAELDAHWRDEWQVFESGAGRDIRERIQAGLLLGELRDNLRYEFRSAQLTDGRRIAGVRLKPNQWLWRGTPGGGKQRYRIGSDQGGDEDERPSWTVDLAPFQMARYAVTVEEWLHFIEGGGYDRTAPWWQSAGQAAKDWLIVKGGSARRPSDWADSRHNNPMQPVRGISHFEALAYAAWADLLDQALQPGPQPAARAATSQALTSRQMQRLQVGVPTEVHWEAGVWGPDVTGLPRPAGWAHLPAGHSPGVLDLNHGYRLRQTAPVGSYSAGATADGLFDVAGNVWEWCANACNVWEWCANAWTDEQRSFGWRTEQLQQAAQVPAEVTDDETRRALRGGAFDFTATQCRPSYRHDNHPGYLINNFGVRLVRWWPPHSGHWTPKG